MAGKAALMWFLLGVVLALIVAVALWPLLWVALAGPSLGFQGFDLLSLLRSCYRALLSGEVTALLTLIALLLPGLVLAWRLLWSSAVRLWRTRQLVAKLLLRQVSPPRGVEHVAERAGVRKRLVYLADPDLYAFVFGVWNPRIVISSGLGQLLDEAELLAVLRHEAFHARRSGLWRNLLLMVLRDAAGFLPLLKSFVDAGHLTEELAADRYAGAADPEALLSGLLKLARRGVRTPPFPSAGGWLEQRIRAACGQPRPRPAAEPHQGFGLLLLVALLSLPLLGHAANWSGLEWHLGNGPSHERTKTC